MTQYEPRSPRIFGPRRCCVLYLLLVLILGTFLYVGWRAARSQVSRPKSRVIGPDDDPDFLWRLNNGDNKPRS